MSVEEIHELRDKGRHIFPDVQQMYYWSREEAMEQYYKRFAKWYLLRKELGLLELEMTHPKNKVL